MKNLYHDSNAISKELQTHCLAQMRKIMTERGSVQPTRHLFISTLFNNFFFFWVHLYYIILLDYTRLVSLVERGREFRFLKAWSKKKVVDRSEIINVMHLAFSKDINF